MKEKEQDERKDEDHLLMDYLLGKLAQPEEIGIEERYVADAHLQDNLLRIEDELVDRYLEDRLSVNERNQFEARFLASPRGRRKLEVARSLIVVASEAAGAKATPGSYERAALRHLRIFARLPIRFALASLVLVLLLVIGWSLRERAGYGPGKERAANQPDLVKSSPAAKPANEASDSTAGRGKSPTAAAVASLVLKPVDRETAHSQEVKIQPGTDQLRIQLNLEGSRKSYNATLLNARGQVKWANHGLRAQPTTSGWALVLMLPTTLFESGEYSVLLSSNETPATTVAEYSFVVRKDKD